MGCPASETTNTRAWKGEDWTISPVNIAGLGNWEIVPLAIAGLLVVVPPPASFDFRVTNGSLHGTRGDNFSDEDAQDLEDGLETLHKYESEGVSGFIRYSDYTERRQRS